MVAERYRVVALAGRGGMGEVYKAEDLKLGQLVALKFLPESLSHDGAALARFHREVRTARQITHPNVCRVHDIGEVQGAVNGLPFLSMEYVDGENLATLLRRIGHLPTEKGVQIARQICSGLSAAHQRGVLHRDLKPANIMLDGDGRSRIMDFGLAGLASESRAAAENLVGTPAYMAPELLKGKPASIQSDIYALGLVLYELFTGKRLFEGRTIEELIRQQDRITPTPSSQLREMDPNVERVIKRCLAKDPDARPRSVLEIAAALPGGDPLAAALAAGETPSPEMVAAAGEKTGLRPATAIACLAAIVMCLWAWVYLSASVTWLGKTSTEISPEVLANKSREIAVRLGYTTKPADTAYGFRNDTPYLQYLLQDPASYATRVAQERPAVLQFWYRESPEPMAAFPQSPAPSAPVRVTLENPAPTVTGMINAVFDPAGRLIAFTAIPARFDPSNSAPTDWSTLLNAADLDSNRLSPAQPELTPPVAFDSRSAWTGTWPGREDLPLRVEAAAWRGRVVYFEMTGPWDMPTQAPADPIVNWRAFFIFVGLMLPATTLVAFVLARRNVILGRSDQRGAFRFGIFVFSVQFLFWLISTDHVSSISEFPLVGFGLSHCVFGGVFMSLLYLACEPYVRRIWPQVLITWSRVLDGKFCDPLVGRDVLIGTLFAIASRLLHAVSVLSTTGIGGAQQLNILIDSRQVIATVLFALAQGLTNALGLFFIIFIVRATLRSQVVAGGVYTLLVVITGAWFSPGGVISMPTLSHLVFAGLGLIALMRFGLIALVSLWTVRILLLSLPVTTNLSVWYAGRSMFVLAILVAIATYACRVSFANQRVFNRTLLEE
jgi:serine/threonine-protein kinase